MKDPFENSNNVERETNKSLKEESLFWDLHPSNVHKTILDNVLHTAHRPDLQDAIDRFIENEKVPYKTFRPTFLSILF